jgi:hypothetical protein
MGIAVDAAVIRNWRRDGSSIFRMVIGPSQATLAQNRAKL